MIFDGVKTITIPEGVVKKIQRDDVVLWRQINLLSGFGVSISYNRVNRPSSTSSTATHNFTVTVDGIAPEHVQRFGVIMYFTNATGLREYTTFVDAEFLSTDDTAAIVTKLVTIDTTSTHNYPTFAGFLIYTDTDGSTKTLKTAKISAVGKTAEKRV